MENALKMELQRYFIELSYKGTNYSGWQIQPNAPTVQAEINDVLTKLNKNQPVNCQGCGRTDTGVHASQFYAHFDYPKIDDLDVFLYKVNGMLSDDISIHQIIPVHSDAHSRFDAYERTYHYFIHQNKNPFLADRSLLINKPLDLLAMNQACEILMTYHDFECFSKSRTSVKTFICDVKMAHWEKTKNGYQFTITANRFLRNMVRAIVGTCLDIGRGEMEVEEMHQIILSKKRSNAGKSVLAHGLFLAEIKYPFQL